MNCLHANIAKLARIDPARVAVTCGARSLTYGQLDENSGRLAAYLVKQGIGVGSTVGIRMARSVDMCVAVLGVLKAGAAYVPLDSALPVRRLRFMLEDCGCERLISDAQTAASNPPHPPTVVLNGAAFQPGLDFGIRSASGVRAQDLAYVIYTSGSTGQPKGVEVPHASAANVVRALTELFGITGSDTVLAVTALSFDISVMDMFVPLSTGARLVIADSRTLRDGRLLGRLITESRPTLLQATPSVWQLLVDAGWAGSSSLRAVSGGEALRPRLAAALLDRCREVWNLYGPTETAVWASAYRIASVEAGATSLPIGVPLPNVTFHILDPDLQPVSVGSAGELYIGGGNLARGYRQRDSLTAQRFILDPRAGPGARLYRTGDRARRLPGGAYEFLGRVDRQVKLHGHRIELEEVEVVLASHPAVSAAAACVRRGEGRPDALLAFVEVDSIALLDSGVLRQFLRERLPEYMQPAAVRVLPTLPRLPNGKIDYRSLPADAVRPRDATPSFVAPHGDVEQWIARIWREILGVEAVGRHDHFIELGGDSISAARIVARINEFHEIELPLRVVFDRPSVAQLADALPPLQLQRPTRSAQKSKPAGAAPLAAGQRRVWFLQHLQPESRAYHFSVSLHIAGSLDVDALTRSLSAVVMRHEIWRTTFPVVDGVPVQEIHPALPVSPSFEDLMRIGDHRRMETLRTRIHDAIRMRFDLARLPLVRWTLYRLAPDRHVLLHCEHHLVHDGWSFNVFLNELVEHYNYFTGRSTLALDEVEMQFADYALWEAQWVESEQAQRSLDYWRRNLAGVPKFLPLPTDFPRPNTQRFAGTVCRTDIDSSRVTALCDMARRRQASLFMVMFAAYAILMHRYAGVSKICIGSGFANRQSTRTELTLGMFVNNVVLHVDFTDDPSARAVLDQVQTKVLEAQTHQGLPFDKVVEALRPAPSLAYNPLFQTVFSFHDAPMPKQTVADCAVDIELLLDDGSAKFDINVIVLPHRVRRLGCDGDRSLAMVWEYNTELFAETTIEAMKEDYSYILDAIIADLECSVSSITLPRLAARRSNPSLANPSAALASRRPRPAARVSEGRDPVLETLVDIWKEVLGEETFGVHDNFFDLGGHSLSLIKIASRIFDAFGVRLDYRTLMGADTVLAQAEAVETARTRSNRRLDA